MLRIVAVPAEGRVVGRRGPSCKASPTEGHSGLSVGQGAPVFEKVPRPWLQPRARRVPSAVEPE